MPSKFSALALAAVLVSAVSVHAQTTAPGTESRGEVKSDAKAARRAGQLPPGEESLPNQDKGGARPKTSSTESRTEVKAEAKDARRAGDLPAGEQSTRTQGKAPPARMPSTEARSEVKSEATAANKAGDKPKGQESVKDQNKGGKTPS